MSCCSGDSKCSHHVQALRYIQSLHPQHLILTGSCCNVRGLLGAAPRVTVMGTDVDKLASMADSSDQGVQLVATSSPAASLSSDPADVIYLGENIPWVQEYLSELAQVLKPGGCLIFAVRYHHGSLPSHLEAEVSEPGEAFSAWKTRLLRAGFSVVEALEEQVHISRYGADGELEFAISDGLLKASKEGA